MPSDLDRHIEQLKRCECIKESEVRELCNKARDILMEESNIQNIYSPITVSLSIIITSHPDMRRHPRSILRHDGII